MIFNKLKSRLEDKERMPCRLWNPKYDDITFKDHDDWRLQHDETSRTVRRTIITLLGYSFFAF